MVSQSASVHHQTDRRPASLIVCSVWLAGVVFAGTILTPLSAAAGTASAAVASVEMAGVKGNQPRRMSGGALARTRGLSQTDRDRLRKPSQFLEQTATPVEEETPSFTPERALASVERVERLVASGAQVADWDSLKKAAGLIPGIRLAISGLESGAMSREETLSLTQGVAELENLEGLALKGRHHTASYRPPSAQPLRAGFGAGLDGEYPRPEGTTTKINTGWILDQHVFDPDSPKTYPTLLSDYKHYDEGQSDIAMGHSDHPDANSMFGWVWEVQSFYWTDTTLVADHANASYCLFVMVSPDGGFTWQLYEILYDPTSASHTTSLDMINPKLAMDITGTTGGGPSAYDRFYIAYEYAKSSTDHDVYVYSETSVLDQPGPSYVTDAQDAAIGTSTNWEGNPAIASDYKTGETSYRVVAYEVAPSSTNHDIYASQSTGDGTTWSTPVAVANSSGMETHPALTAGATGDGSGGSPFTATMHLAYNNDGYITQLLLNPGFEDGHTTAWTESRGTILDNSGTNPPRTGSWLAWLGGDNSRTDTLYQQVAIPSGASSAQLSFYLKIASAEGTTTAYDYLYIRVRNSAGTLLATLGTFSNRNKTTYANYTLVTYDMSSYMGQTVRVSFEATTDSTYITSFFVDDTALTETYATVQTHQICYANATHPGTAYPTALAAFAKIVVLGSVGSPSWPYGPPAIAASHGGSATVTGGRVVVAADQLFPADQPNAGDPVRYQVNYAVNTCNGMGGTSCGSISGCSPAVSLNWNAYYFYDPAADYRFPALVVDGVSWVQGTSSTPQNGIANWPEIFMGYYYRPLNASSPFGAVEMIVTDASDEKCAGFASGAWYLLTAAEKASDSDDRVVAKQGTVSAFNYFAGWPGICFNKRLNHLGATVNDDVYFTTLGDNYIIDTLSSGVHINAYWQFYGTSYVGPWTYPWPAGFEWTLTADASAIDNDHSYTFSSWSNGDTTTATTIASDWCAAGATCQSTSINALYNKVGISPLRVPYSSTPTKTTTANHGTDVTVTWDAVNCVSANYHLLYGKGENLPSWTVDAGVCGMGTSGSYAWAGVPNPSAYTSRYLWFLVVGDDGSSTEGSWGLTSPGGAEEGGASASNKCGMTTKDVSGTCGTP